MIPISSTRGGDITEVGIRYQQSEISTEPGYLTLNLNQSQLVTYSRRRHLGQTQYNQTINFYLFLLMMMTDLTFFKSIFDSEPLARWWKELWLPSDYIKINNQLLLIQQGIQIFDPYRLLTQVSFRKEPAAGRLRL